MTQDPNKKTLRSFQCRDYLWEIFEQMSQELECSVDYLVNEAMRQYARSRNYGVRSPSSPGMQRPSAAPSSSGGIPSLGGAGQQPSGRPPIPSAPPPPPQRQPPQAPPPAQQQGQGYYSQPAGQGYPQRSGYPQQGYGQSQGPYPPAPPAARPPGPSSYPPPPPTQRPAPPQYGGAPQPAQQQAPIQQHPPQSPGSAPPPLPNAPRQHGGQPAASPGQAPPLYVIFNGQKIPITKGEFVIGRGSKTADLPIKDGNISRRHAAVVYQEGAYYLKDLGSTNGIEFAGRRVDAKRVDEGDVFQICDYELRFTYR